MSKISAAGVLCVIGVLNGIGGAAEAGNAVWGTKTTITSDTPLHSFGSYGESRKIYISWGNGTATGEQATPASIRAECTDTTPEVDEIQRIPAQWDLSGVVVVNTRTASGAGAMDVSYAAPMHYGITRIGTKPATPHGTPDIISASTSTTRVAGCSKKYVILWAGWDYKPLRAQIQNGAGAPWHGYNTSGPLYGLLAYGSSDGQSNGTVEAARNITLDTLGEKLDMLRADHNNPIPLDVALSLTDELNKYARVWHNGVDVTNQPAIRLMPGGSLAISVEKMATRLVAKGYVIATVTSP